MIHLGTVDLDPSRRRLRVRGAIVPLSARAFDVLELLIEAGGGVVPKAEVFRRVWPGRVVEENNLQVHISAIRKALGEDRELVQTVSKRGYRFMVEHVVNPTGTKLRVASETSWAVRTNLSIPVSEMIGREGAIEDVISMLSDRKLVTLTGIGGIGKTRLSLEVAHRLLPSFPDGVWLAELGSLADSTLVGGIVGNALGANIDNREESSKAIAEVIGNKCLLLVLDNCEHLIESVAELVEHVAKSAPNVRILSTSREPLGVEGEYVYVVPSLEVRPLDADTGEVTKVHDFQSQVIHSSAVTLFLARMRALTSELPTDAHALTLIEAICRRLDGIPLAIEIAAARAPTLGIEQLHGRLDDRFHLLMDSRRLVMSRHRTLRAALDWSFDLLSETEQMMLSSLGIFAGGFTLDAALAISPPGMPPLLAIDTVTNLVHKSLIVVDFGLAGARYRLLEITRSYAVQKLYEQGRWDDVARRHLIFFTALLGNSVPDPGPEQREPRLAYFRRELDNVRAALEWAFLEKREVVLGISLTAMATPLMYDLLLVEECAALAERALRELAVHGESDLRDETQLLVVRAAAIAYTEGPTDEVAALWERVIGHALKLDDANLEVRAAWGIWNQKVYAGRPMDSMPFADWTITATADAIGRHEEVFALHSHRKMGTSLHFLGDQNQARFHLEEIVARFDSTVHFVKSVGGRIDHGYGSRITLARVLWLQGLFDQATTLNERNVEEAERTPYPLLACYGLLDTTIPLALMRARWDDARRFCLELNKRLSITRLPIWEACAACFVEMVAIGSGEGQARFPFLASKIERLRQMNYLVHLSMIQGFMAEQLGAYGRHDDGLALAEQALVDSEDRGENWYAAELERVRGELIVKCGGSNAQERAEACFTRGIEIAQSQGALYWELRNAMSLVNLPHGQFRGLSASEMLRSIYCRFTEGFDTAELIAARSRLDYPGDSIRMKST